MSQNVLVVEDEERMREFIGVYFRAEGFQVLEAKNGMKAIDIFNKNKIDLVILDVMMPELDGFQVCRRLRENSSVPIIILTAVVGEDEQLMGYELGADDYMTKPFKGKILVAKAKRVMDRVYSEEGKNTLIFEGINIDLDSRLIKIDSKIIEFAPKEFEFIDISCTKSRDY